MDAEHDFSLRFFSNFYWLLKTTFVYGSSVVSLTVYICVICVFLMATLRYFEDLV